MEIVLTEDTKNDQPVFVQAPQNQKVEKEKPKDEVKFKSNQTQRTELETFKAPDQIADMQANLESGGGNNGKTEETKPEEVEPEKTTENGDLQSERRPLELPGMGNSTSRSIPAYVQQQLPPGVRLGNVTSLNTDENKYYSFNQRLLARFIPLWGNSVRSALYQWLNENNYPPISKTWVTNVEIIMDEKGEILDVQPFRLSGLWSIDNAAINSFKKIKNVPNPPKEMVDENGYIHLQFQTEVLWIPQPGVRYHGGGPNSN